MSDDWSSLRNHVRRWSAGPTTNWTGRQPAPDLLDRGWERRLLLDQRMALPPLLAKWRQLDRTEPEERSELHPEDNLDDGGSIELRKVVFERRGAAQRLASERTRTERAAGGLDRVE